MEAHTKLTAERFEDVQLRQRSIGKEIRRFFDAAAGEEVPPQLLDLMHKLGTRKRNDDGA
jgi:hypothetical protein